MSNNIITAEERKTIFNNMIRLLDEYDYSYTYEALHKIIDTWAEQKADLIALFKKHPNYVEGKFMIAFNSNWSREIDDDGAARFIQWIGRNLDVIQSNFPDTIQQVRKKEAKDDWCYPDYDSRYTLTRDTDFLTYNVNYLAHQFVSQDTAEQFNRIDPSMRFSEGMKMSRAINKICHWLGVDKLPDYNKEFAKYADSINPLSIVRHTIISINPIDYLTMSFGNSWASCHTIDKENRRGMPNAYEGQYSSGTISYMLDQVSMVFYTVSADYEGDNYFFEPKINREMFHYGEDKLIQGRLYPQDNDDGAEHIYKNIREIVQKVLADCLNIPNYWVVKKGTDEASKYVYSQGTHYHDYECYNNCTLSIPKDKKENAECITIGHDPICIKCGREHDIEDNINCCDPGYVCCDCGERVDEDDVIWIDDQTYCRDCITYCTCCDQYVRNEDATYVSTTGEYICNSCLEEHFVACDECGYYVRMEDSVFIPSKNITVCSDCFEDFVVCQGCGKYYKIDSMHFDDNNNAFCDDCWEEIQENENEEEEN